MHYPTRPVDRDKAEAELVEIELGNVTTPIVEKKSEVKPEKKKTLTANLKRLSQLGHSKRKKDSAGSLKEVA